MKKYQIYRARMIALSGVAALMLGCVTPALGARAEDAKEQEVQNQVENNVDENIDYNSDFSGQGENADWQIAEGPGGEKSGTVSYNDGEMTLQGFQGIAFDNKAPEIKDGEMTATFKASQLNSLMLVFRYQDKDNFASLGFGTNNVMYVTRENGAESYNIADFQYDYSNQDYVTVKCVFNGEHLKLFIDGKMAADWTAGFFQGKGKIGIRTWGGAKDVTFQSAGCKSLLLDTGALEEKLKEAGSLQKDLYTQESYAKLEEAMDAAAIALAQAETQEEIDGALAALQEAIDGLKEIEDTRITVEEDYTGGAGGTQWSSAYEEKDGSLQFNVPAGKSVINENEKLAKLDAGLYTYRIKTDSKGRFGVSFNGNAVYSEKAGTYKIKNLKSGGEAVIAEENLELQADTWYEIKIIKNMEIFRLYADGLVIASEERDDLASEAGQIGLYNPSGQTMDMQIAACEGYELYNYKNDFSSPDSLGEWELENASVSYAEEGELNGSGEAAVKLQGVSRAIAKGTPKISDGIYEFDIRENADVGSGRLGFMFRAAGLDRFEQIYHDTGSTWGVRTKVPGSSQEWAQQDTFANGIDFAENENHHIRMEVEGDSIKLWIDDAYAGAVNLARNPVKGHFGLLKWYTGADVRLDNLQIRETIEIRPEMQEPDPLTLENKKMKVTLDRNFPYIIQYEMNGKTLQGNKEGQNAVLINGETYYPSVSCKEEKDKAVYTLRIPSARISMKVTYTLEDNKIKINVTDINETGNIKVQTIQFKDEVLATTGDDVQTSSMGMNVYGTGPTGYASMLDTIWETMDEAQAGVTNQTYATMASSGLALTVNNNTINTKARFVCKVSEQDGSKIGQIGNGTFDYTLPGSDKVYEPWAVITLCEDYNEDGEVNYQDAAANYKNIRTEVFGEDEMKNNLMWIAYNSVSQVQEPFMRTLDLGKQVSNFTDGFGQMVMQKGYQAEGHDTQHGMYAYNVGERQGGVEELRKVMELGEKYNIKFGIHVNVNEHHVESMNADVVRQPLSPGWGLWSQAYWVNQEKDVVSGNREKRLRMLADELPDLKFIYYDIYGNDGAPVWMGQSLAEVTNDMGMILGTEFNGPLEQQAAFTHWGNDPDYPNVGNESKLMRYFKNDTDIFIGNALLNGNKMLNIATWQAQNTDMVRGVETFYNHVLPTKYLQHFDLLDYEDDYAKFTDGVKTERKGDVIELSKDGKKIASWTWSYNSSNQEITGDAILLIPWFDNDSKTKDPSDADKLYYWNPAGGKTTWDVSVHNGWSDGTTADIYRLTTDAKEKVGQAVVKNGKITLDQEAGYGYVLYPTGTKPEKAVTNFGEGTALKDPNFIDDHGDSWTLSGKAEITKDDGYNPYLGFSGEGTATQTMKGLESGKTYTVYGFADVGEDSTLKMSVTIDGKTYDNEYGPAELTYRGIPRYADTKTQKVRIVFDVPEGTDTAKLRFEGNGTIRLQDLRVWENLSRTPQITDEGMEDYILYEDFENVEQGYGPFMVDARHTSWDAPVQMAEYRESRPEYGEDWEQYSDYVANGRYSLKTDIGGNGFDAGNTANGPIYQSIPEVVKFEADTEYEINFKYVTGVDDRHNIQVKDKDGNVVYEYVFKATEREEGKHSLSTAEETARFVTGNREDYYLVVNLIDNQAGLTPNLDENGSFMERTFLSLDDISIKKVTDGQDNTGGDDGEDEEGKDEGDKEEGGNTETGKDEQNGNSGTSVKTGDMTSPWLFAGLSVVCIGSGAVIVRTLYTRRKRNQH